MCNDRRHFLKLAAKLGASQSLARLAHAVPMGLSAITAKAFAAAATAPDSDFNFVLFRIPGGMDSTLGLHPWTESNSKFNETDLWLNYNPNLDVSRLIGGTQISLGPSTAAIVPFAKRMAIIRGIYVGSSDLGHPAAIQHVSSGRTQESAPHLAAYIGEKYPAVAGGFVVTNTLIQRGLLNSFPTILTQALKQMGEVDKFSTTSSLGLYKDKSLAVNRYLGLLEKKHLLVKFSDVLKAQTRGAEVHDETVALASLAVGLSRVAQIDLEDETRSLDTHAGHENHRSFQRMRWDRIGAFLQGLVDVGIYDKTLVVVTTEFNRSPGKNANQGKDHNYSDNAVALFGRDILGGNVVGDHKLYLPSKKRPLSLWAGNFINYRTGQTTELDATIEMRKSKAKIVLPANVDLIRPADVWTTITRSFGPELGKVLPPDGKVIPRVFSSLT